MTFSAAGSFIDATGTFSLTPAGAGHFILVEVMNVDNSTVNCTALTSSNVTWSLLGSFQGSVSTGTLALFIGTVTSTSTANVTLTWSGTAPADIRIDGHEFSSSSGTWALDQIGHIDSSGTNTFASLIPAGAGGLYYGWAFDSGTAVAGATSGYTYFVDSHSNGGLFNTSCTSSAQAPTWGDSGFQLGIMALIREMPPATPPPALIPPGPFSPMTFATFLPPPPPAPIPPPSFDAGTGTDAGSVTATVSDSDAGSGADTGSAVPGATDVDSGSGADAGSVSAAVPGADTAAGADAGSVTADLASADTASGTDAGTAGPFSADTGSAADSGSESAYVAPFRPTSVLWSAPDKLSKSGGTMP